jgi:hypothetical protein
VLYLFNSAYRTRYLINVLNTLYLPNGSTNEYRYRYRPGTGPDEHVNVNPEDVGRLRSLPGLTPVTIVFVDRFHEGGYYYHPLRQGTFAYEHEEGDRMFFRARLGDYIYPRDSDAFNQMFSERLASHGIPHLSGRDPWTSDDGWYVVPADDVFSRRGDYHCGEDAWETCVDQLSRCRAFDRHEPANRPAGKPGAKQGTHRTAIPRATDETGLREFVFARGSLKNASGKPVPCGLESQDSVFTLVRSGRYELDLSYRYSAQASDTGSRATVTYRSGDRLVPLGDQAAAIDSQANTLRYLFTTKKYLEQRSDSITCDFESGQPGATVAS